MKLTILLASLSFGAAAFANPVPIRLGRGPRVSVSHMTCAQARATSQKYGYYLKDTADGPVPIYPIEATPNGLHCSGTKNTAVPQVERTLDSRACIVSWYCI